MARGRVLLILFLLEQLLSNYTWSSFFDYSAIPDYPPAAARCITAAPRYNIAFLIPLTAHHPATLLQR